MYSLELATEPLSELFDAPAHFTPSVCKEGDGLSTNYKDIQTLYVDNHVKLEELDERMKKMDLWDVIQIPHYHDKDNSDVKMKWGCNVTCVCLLKHWATIPIERIIDYKTDINRWTKHDGESSEWLSDLIYVSSTPELCALVKEKASMAPTTKSWLPL